MDKKSKGFIKLDRNIFEHWIFQDAEKFRAFVDLIQLARYQDVQLLIGNEVAEVKRGSYYTSELKLAERWGWSRKKVRAYLNLLEKEHMITKKGTTKGTTLTVVNYGFYQDEGTTKGTTKEHQKNNEGTSKEQRRNIKGYTKEESKEREERKESIRKDKNNNKLLLSLFEELGFGTINSINAAELIELEKEYSTEWVKEALRESNSAGIRNLKYVNGILKNWKSKGFKAEKIKHKNNDNTKGFNNFEPRSYDYDSLEKKLLGWDKDE